MKNPLVSTQRSVIPYTLEDTRRFLEDHKIHDWEMWGQGTTRPLDGFVDLLNNAHVILDLEGTQPLITIHVAVIGMYYDTGDEILELTETRQTNRVTGESRLRGYDGIGETLHVNESPVDAAVRGLAEELRFTDPATYHITPRPILSELGTEVESGKWPPLRFRYHRHIFGCFITPQLFKPEGYMETRGDWTIYFKWGEAATMQLNDTTSVLIWINPATIISSDDLFNAWKSSILNR
jgi:hypothetical protein